MTREQLEQQALDAALTDMALLLELTPEEITDIVRTSTDEELKAYIEE